MDRGNEDDSVGQCIGSGLKLLISAQQEGQVEPRGQNSYGPNVLNNRGIGLVDSLPSSSLGPDNCDAMLSVPSLVGGEGSPSRAKVDASVSLVVPGPSRGRGRRRGRGARGGRGGGGRGVIVPGALSASCRFVQFARGIGRRPRTSPLVPNSTSGSSGLVLHVDLPNLNSIPEMEADVDEEDGGEDYEEENDGGMVGDTTTLGDLDSSSGSGSLIGATAAGRLLAIGRKTGVTFRCAEETMIGKFAQLEERDKREKEEKGMRNNGHQWLCVH